MKRAAGGSTVRVLREEGAAAAGESSDEEAGTARPDSPGSPELSKKLLVAAPEEVDEDADEAGSPGLHSPVSPKAGPSTSLLGGK